jgi:hypothetical protein
MTRPRVHQTHAPALSWYLVVMVVRRQMAPFAQISGSSAVGTMRCVHLVHSSDLVTCSPGP